MGFLDRFRTYVRIIPCKRTPVVRLFLHALCSLCSLRPLYSSFEPHRTQRPQRRTLAARPSPGLHRNRHSHFRHLCGTIVKGVNIPRQSRGMSTRNHSHRGSVMTGQQTSEQQSRLTFVHRVYLCLLAAILITSLSGCVGVADCKTDIPRLFVKGKVIDNLAGPAEGVQLVLARPGPWYINDNTLASGDLAESRDYARASVVSDGNGAFSHEFGCGTICYGGVVIPFVPTLWASRREALRPTLYLSIKEGIYEVQAVGRRMARIGAYDAGRRDFTWRKEFNGPVSAEYRKSKGVDTFLITIVQ